MKRFLAATAIAFATLGTAHSATLSDFPSMGFICEGSSNAKASVYIDTAGRMIYVSTNTARVHRAAIFAPMIGNMEVQNEFGHYEVRPVLTQLQFDREVFTFNSSVTATPYWMTYNRSAFDCISASLDKVAFLKDEYRASASDQKAPVAAPVYAPSDMR